MAVPPSAPATAPITALLTLAPPNPVPLPVVPVFAQPAKSHT